MSETTEPLNEPTEQVATVTEPPPAATAEPVVVKQKPNRLYQIAAWVAIAAGTLLIVSVIFFWGFVLGRHSGGPGQHGHHGQHHGESSMSDRGGPGRGPMMWPGPGGHGPGNFGPGGGGPGNGGPGSAGPGNFGPGGPGQTPPQPGQQAPTPRP
jgi:hypothetical protein